MNRVLKIQLVLLFLGAASIAEAACTNTIVYTPDGKQTVCQVCTDMNGQVTTICY